ncbi:MAG: Gfo/Idh/MocA family oxidoreductase [Promethearchaeia archaeon]
MLRVGIIGCGDIANLNVLGYLRSQDTELIAVCDTDIKRAGEKLERWGLRTVKIYKDYKKMIDHEDLDIVEILTPHHLHFPMTEYCARAGVTGITVQKPLAHTITDCEKMIQVCKQEKVKLKLFENFRFYPVFLKAKELLDQGIIGELLNFRINSIGTGGPGMPRGLNSLIWRVKLDTCGGGPWVYDDGIHKFSMALWLMGEGRVEKVYGWIDYFTGVMDSPSYIFWKYPSKNSDKPPKFGSMQFTLAPNVYYPSNYYDCDEYIEISGTKGIMWLNQCTSGGNYISRSPQFPPVVVYVDGEVKSFGKDLPRDWRYSFINSTEHFINVIKNGGKPIYTGEEGKNLCIFAKMPYISQQQKRPIYWEEITIENEQNRECIVEQPANLDASGLAKYNRMKSRDLRKAIREGLKHQKFKYQYEYEE